MPDEQSFFFYPINFEKKLETENVLVVVLLNIRSIDFCLSLQHIVSDRSIALNNRINDFVNVQKLTYP